MVEYYDQKRTPAPDYQPRDRVYLDASDIQTTRPSKKLSHQRLGPFHIIKKVGNGAYQLQLPPSMSRLHPVFNVVKLTPAPEDPVQGWHVPPPPLLEIIDREEEWVIEEILNSRMINQKLQYLVKWDGFRIEHNSWEPWDNIHAPDLVSEFHRKHPRAPQLIRLIDFNAIAFRSIPSSVVLGHHSLEGGMDVRGHLQAPMSLTEYVCLTTPDKLHLADTPYILPHRQWPHHSSPIVSLSQPPLTNQAQSWT